MENSDALRDDAKRNPTNGLISSIRAAFTSWWTVFGIVAASVTGFNLSRNLLQIELSEVIGEIIRFYQSLIHLPIMWLIDWAHWPAAPAWAIDTGVLWLLLGGVVLRSAWPIRLGLHNSAGFLTKHTNRLWGRILYLNLPMFVGLTVVFWPLVIFFMVERPIAFQKEWKAAGRKTIAFSKPLHADQQLHAQYRFLHDLRIVLASQCALTFVCIAAWFALNALINLYGQ